MIDSTHTTEHTELQIDTVEGLRDFLQHTKELYAVLLDAAQTAPIAIEKLQEAEVAFHRVCDVTEMCLHSLRLGIPLNDVLVSEIQERYNDIATIYDLFVIDTTPEQPIESPVPQAAVPVTSDAFVTAATTLAEKARVLLVRYEDLAAVPDQKDELSIARFYYGQLAELSKEVSATAEAIALQKPVLDVSPTLRTSTTKMLEELDKKLNAIDKELDRFFEPEIPDVSPKQDLSNDQAVQAEKRERMGRKSEFSDIVSRVLLDSRYAAFIKERFHTTSQFELQLTREVAKIEAPSKFDVLLGIRHASAFSFLKDMTLAELNVFDHSPRVVIRGELAAKNIPYEQYVEWMYILNDIQAILGAPDHITVGEVFVRAELEVLLHEQVTT